MAKRIKRTHKVVMHREKLEQCIRHVYCYGKGEALAKVLGEATLNPEEQDWTIVDLSAAYVVTETKEIDATNL